MQTAPHMSKPILVLGLIDGARPRNIIASKIPSAIESRCARVLAHSAIGVADDTRSMTRVTFAIKIIPNAA